MLTCLKMTPLRHVCELMSHESKWLEVGSPQVRVMARVGQRSQGCRLQHCRRLCMLWVCWKGRLGWVVNEPLNGTCENVPLQYISQKSPACQPHSTCRGCGLEIVKP